LPANEDEFSGPTRGGMVSWQVGGNDSEVSWCNSSYFLGHEDLFLHELVVLCKNHQFFFLFILFQDWQDSILFKVLDSKL
jgi:hypothetical protein